MTTAPKLSTLVACVSVGLVGTALLVPALPWRPWLGLAGFSLLGIVALADRGRVSRRRLMPLGVYLLCIGAKFGGAAVWGSRFASLEPVLLAVSIGAVLLSLLGWMTETRAGSLVRR